MPALNHMDHECHSTFIIGSNVYNLLEFIKVDVKCPTICMPHAIYGSMVVSINEGIMDKNQ